MITDLPTQQCYKQCDDCKKFTDFLYPRMPCLRAVSDTPLATSELFRLCGRCTQSTEKYYDPQSATLYSIQGVTYA